MDGVLPIIKHHSGCDYHRIINPMIHLGFDIKNQPQQSNPNVLKETKVLFFNRTPEQDYDKVIHFKKKYGFKLVVDLDDSWELNILHPSYAVFNKKEDEAVKWIKASDAVIVTTARLADKVRDLNKNVHVIPNGLPFGKGQFNDLKSESNQLRFIYTGAESHVFDVQLLKYPIEKVRNQKQMQFILAGYQDKNPQIWNRIESVFKKHPNYERRSFLPLDKYMNTYIDSDVSLVPLEHNNFTQFKSNLKILEAGCKYIPVICSDVPPYSDEPNREVITFAKNTGDWVKAMTYFYNNPNAVKDKGEILGEYVRKHYDLIKVNEYRKQLFEHLMQ